MSQSERHTWILFLIHDWHKKNRRATLLRTAQRKCFHAMQDETLHGTSNFRNVLLKIPSFWNPLEYNDACEGNVMAETTARQVADCLIRFLAEHAIQSLTSSFRSSFTMPKYS
jgi:hypothetical protein